MDAVVLLKGLGALLLELHRALSGLTERTFCAFRDADVEISRFRCGSQSFSLPGSANFHQVEFGGRIFGRAM